MIIFGAQLISSNNVVSNVFDVQNTMPWLKLKAVEMEPVVSGEFLVIEVNPESEFIFVNFFFTLSTGASVRFSVFNFEILPEVSDVFSHD
jgi:hypothetical protein